MTYLYNISFSFFFCYVCLCADCFGPVRLSCVEHQGLNTSTLIHYHEVDYNRFVYVVNFCVFFFVICMLLYYINLRLLLRIHIHVNACFIHYLFVTLTTLFVHIHCIGISLSRHFFFLRKTSTSTMSATPKQKSETNTIPRTTHS